MQKPMFNLLNNGKHLTAQLCTGQGAVLSALESWDLSSPTSMNLPDVAFSGSF